MRESMNEFTQWMDTISMKELEIEEPTTGDLPVVGKQPQQSVTGEQEGSIRVSLSQYDPEKGQLLSRTASWGNAGLVFVLKTPLTLDEALQRIDNQLNSLGQTAVSLKEQEHVAADQLLPVIEPGDTVLQEQEAPAFQSQPTHYGECPAQGAIVAPTVVHGLLLLKGLLQFFRAQYGQEIIEQIWQQCLQEWNTQQ